MRIKEWLTDWLTAGGPSKLVPPLVLPLEQPRRKIGSSSSCYWSPAKNTRHFQFHKRKDLKSRATFLRNLLGHNWGCCRLPGLCAVVARAAAGLLQGSLSLFERSRFFFLPLFFKLTLLNSNQIRRGKSYREKLLLLLLLLLLPAAGWSCEIVINQAKKEKEIWNVAGLENLKEKEWEGKKLTPSFSLKADFFGKRASSIFERDVIGRSRKMHDCVVYIAQTVMMLGDYFTRD